MPINILDNESKVEDMDFEKIVIKGITDKNNRKSLHKYFYREFKKAEKEEFFDADEFFDGCIAVTKKWEGNIQKRIDRRKRELYIMSSIADEGRADKMDGETQEEANKRLKQYAQDELKNVRPDGIGSMTYYSHIQYNRNGIFFNANLPADEIDFVCRSIMRARLIPMKKYLEEAKKNAPKQKENKKSLRKNSEKKE